MGFFGKIKNILFEDDDEVEEMPVYTKEEVKEAPKKTVEERTIPDNEEPIMTSDNSRFRNVKRDIDLSYDEKDVLGEIPGAMDVMETPKREEEPVKVPQEEKKSPFLSFDEDEFERLNSRIAKNENRVKKEVKNVGVPVSTNVARKANNHFSSTSTSRDTRIENSDRYKINSGTLGNGKKPFTPSPVISPVYGILDKNYKKDDIIDKQGGMKREKVVKPVVRHEEPVEKETLVEKETVYEVDIDSVRKKAYGSLENLEKTYSKIEIPELKNDKKEEEPVIEKELPVEEEKVSVVTPEKVSIEDQLDEKFEISHSIEEDLETSDTTDDLDEVVEKVIETKKVDATSEKKKPQLLDELEKTSTLQILDDIEKELNSIKPITKDVDTKEKDIEKEQLDNDDTLETDLFNLIDSMYEEGEEEEEND